MTPVRCLVDDDPGRNCPPASLVALFNHSERHFNRDRGRQSKRSPTDIKKRSKLCRLHLCRDDYDARIYPLSFISISAHFLSWTRSAGHSKFSQDGKSVGSHLGPEMGLPTQLGPYRPITGAILVEGEHMTSARRDETHSQMAVEPACVPGGWHLALSLT
jgi:hypothetical protein